jgi:hypothetical protein
MISLAAFAILNYGSSMGIAHVGFDSVMLVGSNCNAWFLAFGSWQPFGDPSTAISRSIHQQTSNDWQTNQSQQTIGRQVFGSLI